MTSPNIDGADRRADGRPGAPRRKWRCRDPSIEGPDDIYGPGSRKDRPGFHTPPIRFPAPSPPFITPFRPQGPGNSGDRSPRPKCRFSSLSSTRRGLSYIRLSSYLRSTSVYRGSRGPGRAGGLLSSPTTGGAPSVSIIQGTLYRPGGGAEGRGWTRTPWGTPRGRRERDGGGLDPDGRELEDGIWTGDVRGDSG